MREASREQEINDRGRAVAGPTHPTGWTRRFTSRITRSRSEVVRAATPIRSQVVAVGVINRLPQAPTAR